MAPRDTFGGRGAGSGFGGFSKSASRLSYVFQPPSFSDISDANVIVAFKNLLKKDSTTKSKALEELIAYAAAHPHEDGGTEDAVLDAWVQMYPRASIDNSRRESHGKTVGLGQILDYAKEAIKETPDTLSDARTTTKEDVEVKYHRVAGGSLSLVLNLLNRADLDALNAELDEFFAMKAINKATSANVFPAVAVLAGFGIMLSPSKAVNHLCNNMVSQVAGAFPSLPSTLSSMVILNGCFSVYEPGTVPVDHRRLGISIKQMTSWTDVPDEMSAGLAAETCKGLQNIAPNVQKLYGPYWNQSVSYCLLLWHRAPQDSVAVRSPYLHASLKLLTTLETLENPNEDLRDVLEEKAMEISRGLISVLKMLGDGEDLPSPAQIVNGLFSRRAEKIPEEHLEDVRQLYSLMASESKDIQTAGFSLVCRRSRLMQEELSLDALLNNDDSARLPEELLSLLLDAPTLEAYPDDVLNRFPAALKTENHLPPLLTFMFDVLGHSAAHALNLDKAGFTSRHVRVYDIKLANAETAERGMQWLLVHLFYEVLKYVPGLFKAWFLDCRSKQTKIAVEAWTTRFFSPLIVADMLDAVMEWQDEKDDEEEPRLHVKVSRAAREIVASYEVDELEGAIAVRVPPSYPLETVTVEGVNRVAVSEKKWQSWLLSTQGSIVFANGSIIDGLGTFRRNVVGALKGQTECAICYSIVSSDKRMPDKRCSTCKNLFHRSCLYKWFQSSNQNSCPLCRNPIDYLGHVHY
ncbi:hypothetical protein P8C59_005021 [Phyllachora maydis]|uniref:E3 ubiquitin-protein ligase listerin n=1 Tax=Phyllachora maydis TaxID=1825666 RepID=A0AAD9I3L0_9PEZI|nr:hypothetical protein P8C59_005021 [Phyllachora maydis]